MSAAWPTITELLTAPTPVEWLDAACAQWQDLLRDHANCEKKAASTAIALMFSYPQDSELALRLARLAREELKHFEQVERLMRQLGVRTQRQHPGRYAAGLRACLRSSEPDRRRDLLLAGALIEARSCERFGLLAPRLPAPIAQLYATLESAEARHYELYLNLAGRPDDASLLLRLTELARCEGQLAARPDPQFRFHSGPPLVPTAVQASC